MTQPKVQLVAPLGNLTVPGMNVTGVVTATTISGDVGVAGSIIQGNNLDIGAGIITATSFVGDQIGTYRAASLTGSPDLVVGVVTSSGFVAQITGDVTGNLTGNVVGTAGSILSGNNLHVGIATATLVGDGSNLTGVGGSVFTHQTITANGAATSIDLSAGNIITLNQSADTTVSFANTSEAMKVTITRVKDSSATARSLTWPSSIQWTYGSDPSLVSDNETGTKFNILSLLTRDSGVTWYGWEVPDTTVPDYEDGTLWAWGRNESGELGQNDLVDRSSPTQIPGTTWGSKKDGVGLNQGGVEASDTNNIIQTKSDGTLWAWGANAYGQLGHNSRTQYSSPVQVGTDTDWAMGFGNGHVSSAIKTDGTLWSWGAGSFGLLGLNQAAPSTEYSSPTQVGTDTDWSTTDGHVCLSLRVRCHIKTDGSLWAWGNKYYGVLGLNEGGSSPSEAFSSPTQIGTGTDWHKTKVNFGTMYGIKTNGSLWSWGKTNYGELGQNEARNSDLSSPTQIGTKTDWTDITSMYVTTFAYNTSGECFAWGYTTDGYGGFSGIHGGGQWTSSPTQLPGTTWVGGSAYRGANAIKTDGTLWGWSVNDFGNVGTNNLTQYSSPIQIGSDTDWDTSPVRIGAQYKTRWSIKTS